MDDNPPGPTAVASIIDLRRFRPELTPEWVRTALLCDGHHSALHGRFTAVYLDGSPPPGGLTAAVTAATRPDAEILLWSPHQSVLAATRELAESTGLANLTTHESIDPPGADGSRARADLVVVDSLFDAVDDPKRAQLLESVESMLRPGGVVCVRYRTTVGWSEVAPVVRLLRRVVALDARPPAEAVPDALGLLRDLRDGNAGYLTARPVVAAWLEELLGTKPADVVAAYIDTDLHPLSHAQLRAAMDSIGCVHVGSTQVGDALRRDHPGTTPRMIDSLRGPVLREAFDDLAVRRCHRTDLFQLGPQPMSKAEQSRAVGEVSVIGLPRVETTERDPGSNRRGERPLPKRVLQPIADGPVTIAELEPDASMRVPLLRRLMTDRIAHPVVTDPSPTGPDDPAARLNRILGRPPTPVRDRIVVSPLISSAVAASPRPTRDELTRLGVR